MLRLLKQVAGVSFGAPLLICLLNFPLKKKIVMTFITVRPNNKYFTKQVAGASFRGLLIICLLNLTLNEKSASHALQFALKYHVFLNQPSAQTWDHIHHSLRCSSHILYCSRIRKKCDREQTDRQTENRESNYRGHSNR